MHKGLNEHKPLVSVGMPIYNGAQYIRRALDSLLAQDYENYEVIISDNASTDSTLEICKQFASRNKIIHIFSNERNLGVIENFIKVLKMANGKYFMWAAVDDFWEPEFITTLVNELEANPHAGVALCAVRRMYPDGKLKDTIKYNGRSNPMNLANSKIAANLLSPRKKTKLLKFNLFIYGVFRLETIIQLLPVAKDMFNLGERAFLSPIALSYRFLYVDKILFIKTFHEKSIQERRPDDEVVTIRKNIGYLQYYYQIMVWIKKSQMIPWKNKLFVFAIPYFIAYRFVYQRRKKMKKKLKKKILKFSNKWFSS